MNWLEIYLYFAIVTSIILSLCYIVFVSVGYYPRIEESSRLQDMSKLLFRIGWILFYIYLLNNYL